MPRNGRVLRRAAQRHGTCQRPEAKGGIALRLADHFLRAFGVSEEQRSFDIADNSELAGHDRNGSLLSDIRGTTFTIAAPRLVITTGSPLDWTSSIIFRQPALKRLAHIRLMVPPLRLYSINTTTANNSPV